MILDKLTYEAWEEKYKPINNPFRKEDPLFETFGKEYDFVKKANPLNIWTLVDGEDGTYIVDGWHYVNRIAYFITEMPHNDEGIEILDMLYSEENEE